MVHIMNSMPWENLDILYDQNWLADIFSLFSGLFGLETTFSLETCHLPRILFPIKICGTHTLLGPNILLHTWTVALSLYTCTVKQIYCTSSVVILTNQSAAFRPSVSNWVYLQFSQLHALIPSHIDQSRVREIEDRRNFRSMNAIGPFTNFLFIYICLRNS